MQRLFEPEEEPQSDLGLLLRTRLGSEPQPDVSDADLGPVPGLEPHLDLQWQGFWDGLFSSFGPALSVSPPRLPNECNLSGVRKRSFAASLLMHGAVVTVGTQLILHGLVLQFGPPEPRLKDYDIKVYKAQYLPQLGDVGGAQEGVSGRSGGNEAYHPRQTIRVARGNKPAATVIHAPKLQLPVTNEPLANLLMLPASKPMLAAPENLPGVARNFRQETRNVVAPPPDVSRAVSRPDLASASVSTQAPQAAPVISAENATVIRRRSEPVGTTETPLPQLKPAEDMNRLAKVIMPVTGLPLPAASASGEGSNPGGEAGAPAPAPSAAGPGGDSNATLMAAANARDGSLVPAFILSTEGGDAIGVRGGSGGEGSLAMSPRGRGRYGMGGSGGGGGIGSGTGPGSGASGEGPGGGSAGSGLGRDPSARGGTSLAEGPGGAGSGQGGRSPFPGISIQGGTVNLPSFASDSGAVGSNPQPMPGEPRNQPGVTVIASPRSGGALRAYGVFQGSQVYTIYISTTHGTAVLQYSEKTSRFGYDNDLTAPEPLYVPVPDGFNTRLLLSCVLTREGRLEKVKILEGQSTGKVPELMESLGQWFFRPVLRSGKPVEVDAILGFRVDTR